MFTLDSDLLGLLMALLTFFIPVITSIMEKRKQKRKEEMSVLQPGREDYVAEQEQEGFLPYESLHIPQKTVPAVEEEEPHHTQASELEELFNEILGIEGEPATVEEAESDAPVEEMAEKELQSDVQKEIPDVIQPETPQDDRGLRRRIKDNPKDMVIFAEILKPKFKEY